MPSIAHVRKSRRCFLSLVAGSALTAVAAPGCDNHTEAVPVPNPRAGGIVCTTVLRTVIDKVDLLFMIDNSASMEDKQSELAARIPELIHRLTDQTPDPITGRLQGTADLHVGVITSSLGSFGTSACDPALSAHNDDSGHLLPRAGAVPIGKAASAAPLAWVFDPRRSPADPYQGASGASELAADAASVITSAQTDGCSYESSLESIYHFLIDPQPYATATVKCAPTSAGDSCIDPVTKKPNQIERVGVDAELLRQRASFLRADSMVAVIMLTDKNDASLKPVSLNWIPWAYAPGTMARGWAACANVPDDVEPDDNSTLRTKYGCTSCFLDGSDANCSVPWPTTKLNMDIDGLNNRKVQQVQKYGFNFLWSRDRYVQGFTQTTVLGSDNRTGPNPLYMSGFRTPDLVLFAAITGVPEDLVANADHTPKILSPSDWSKIVDPERTKRDPRMIESVAPRAGLSKYKGGGDLSASPYDSNSPFFNGNGGERDVANGDDLQYACIQKRSSTATNDDCSDAATAASNPLCTSTGGTYVQSYYKAYPGLRQLRVAASLGSSGFVGSICAQSYGPALEGIFGKIKDALSGQCVSWVLSPDPSGQAPCSIVEAFAGPTGPAGETSCEQINHGATGYCTPGKAPCRVDGTAYPPVSPADAAPALTLCLHVTDPYGGVITDGVTPIFDSASGNVYAQSSRDIHGTKHLVCEIAQLTGAAGASCRTDPKFTMSSGGGWCYSTDQKVIGDKCVKQGALGTIKFEGVTATHRGSQVFPSCMAGGS